MENVAKCIGTGNGTKCDAVATAKLRGGKRPNICVPCLLTRHNNKMALDAIYVLTQRAYMAADKQRALTAAKKAAR